MRRFGPYRFNVDADMAARTVRMQVQRATKRAGEDVHLLGGDSATPPEPGVQQREVRRRPDRVLQRPAEYRFHAAAQDRFEVGAGVRDDLPR